MGVGATSVGTGGYNGTGTDWEDEGAPGNYWSCFEVYLKANTSVGAEDGVYKFWINGVLEAEKTDLAWSDDGSQVTPRLLWNYVMLGGNNNNPYALVADANYDQIENWKDLQDRSRPYNSYIEDGGFNKSHWRSVSKKNKTEKKKKHKNKSDVFVEFRVDKIQRANFHEWGFELLHPWLAATL